MRKFTLLIPFVVLLGFSAFGQANLKVIITNVKQVKGNMAVALFNHPEDFLKKHGGFTGKFVQVKQKGQVVITIFDVPEGTYAASIFHDENGNGEMDRNALGIPTESYGFSNNANGTFGPPSYEDAVFEINGEETVITVKLN